MEPQIEWSDTLKFVHPGRKSSLPQYGKGGLTGKHFAALRPVKSNGISNYNLITGIKL